ncbi:MAG TPA: hypothetical protein DEB09_04220 [Candidatus Magasanikbacteria bacterium]|nr:hypothetical protein [Candidatus Magasanikbacteria bacterium]
MSDDAFCVNLLNSSLGGRSTSSCPLLLCGTHKHHYKWLFLFYFNSHLDKQKKFRYYIVSFIFDGFGGVVPGGPKGDYSPEGGVLESPHLHHSNQGMARTVGG